MAGSRYDAPINTPIILQAKIYVNNVPTNVYQIVRAEIYDDFNKAKAPYGTYVPKQKIPATQISHPSSIIGLYQYVASAIGTANTYYDKLYFVLDQGGETKNGIMPFYVRKTSAGALPPSSKEKAHIVLNMFDVIDTADCSKPVYVEMNVNYAFYNGDIIRKEREMFKSNNAGIVSMDLIETTTMTEDTGTDVYYTLEIPSIDYKRSFTVPKGTISANFFDLPEYTGAG
jgi:hypothetical protein